MKGADQIIDHLLAVEGGYVDHPDDKGGPTKYGITQAVARACGYHGDIKDLSEDWARRIYTEQYYTDPGFDRVSNVSLSIAMEMTDTGVNMGVTTAVRFLQQSLNALNDQATHYEDISVDGYIGKKTITALQAYIRKRGAQGERVMLKALNALQGARYIELAEARLENESFVYGWIRERVSLLGPAGEL